MTVAAVEGKCWEETTDEELCKKPAWLLVAITCEDCWCWEMIAPIPICFVPEGTLRMLQIVGLSQDEQGVDIRYKLINPAKPLSARPVVVSKISEP